MFDIKVIRTVVTGDEFSEHLISFSIRSNYYYLKSNSPYYATSDSPNYTKTSANDAPESGGGTVVKCEMCGAKNVPLEEVRISNNRGTFYR